MFKVENDEKYFYDVKKEEWVSMKDKKQLLLFKYDKNKFAFDPDTCIRRFALTPIKQKKDEPSLNFGEIMETFNIKKRAQIRIGRRYIDIPAGSFIIINELFEIFSFKESVFHEYFEENKEVGRRLKSKKVKAEPVIKSKTEVGEVND